VAALELQNHDLRLAAEEREKEVGRIARSYIKYEI
jgi:hypothetical protein